MYHADVYNIAFLGFRVHFSVEGRGLSLCSPIFSLVSKVPLHKRIFGSPLPREFGVKQGPHSPGKTWKPWKTWKKLLFFIINLENGGLAQVTER